MNLIGTNLCILLFIRFTDIKKMFQYIYLEIKINFSQNKYITRLKYLEIVATYDFLFSYFNLNKISNLSLCLL
jgi:hypothetical protein